MSIKKVFVVVFVIALFILITILIFWLKPLDHDVEKSPFVPDKTTAALPSPNQIEPLHQVINAGKIPTVVEKNMLKAIDASTAAAHLPHQIMQDNDDRSYIEYNPHTIESKSIGDHISINVPKTGRIYDGIITNIDRVNSDILTWHGHFNGMNEADSNFTITQSIKEKYANGVLNTPDGNFILESKDGYGWIKNQEPTSTQ